jgi:hypothetical protein
MFNNNLEYMYCHVFEWLRRGFGLEIGFIDNPQVVTTISGNTILL